MDALLDELLKAVFVAVSGVVGTLLAALVVKLLQRIGLAVSAEQQAKLEKLAQDAVLATEELARARIKDGVGKVASAEKLTQAVELLLRKVPNISQEEASVLVQHPPVVRPELLREPGGALDVREQKRHETAWQLRPGRHALYLRA